MPVGGERRAPDASGMVYLVGAGPGDPGLVTVRASELVARAEVLVYDRLIPPGLVDQAPVGCERVYVGKLPDRHVLPQAEINALVVARAQAGRLVVRLKGGDPFVFGRGGDEAVACAAAGVPFEVVPGVTSAVAVPAYAGIPLTQRDLSSAFAVVTCHEDPATAASPAAPGRVLLARADLANPELAAAITAKGGHPHEVTAYRTVPLDDLDPDARKRLDGGEVDWVAFTAASTVTGFVRAYGGPPPAAVRVAAIGPVTAAAVLEAGMRLDATATEHTIPGLVAAIERAEQRPSDAPSRAAPPPTSEVTHGLAPLDVSEFGHRRAPAGEDSEVGHRRAPAGLRSDEGATREAGA